jgi:hypothetical protein
MTVAVATTQRSRRLDGIDEGRPISTLERVISDYTDMGLPLILNKHIF